MIVATPRWHTRAGVSWRDIPIPLADWLFDTGSLTRHLRKLCSQLRVRVIQQGWAQPRPDERRALHLRPCTWVWTREVLLCGNNQPWVFARTVIPTRTFTSGRGRRLAYLGNRPLGEVLFSDPCIRRGIVEVARLTPNHALYQCATAELPEPPAIRWGRRSLFWIDHSPLLVCEVFLAALPTHTP